MTNALGHTFFVRATITTNCNRHADCGGPNLDRT